MTARQRERVAGVIRHEALAWALGAASVREIDRINIRRATILAMQRAVARLPHAPDRLLVDGLPVPELGTKHEALIGGDSRCQSIAAASILAKCVRDRLMVLLAQKYPAFQWDRNKGYGTADHLAAIDETGPTPHHRRSFAPVVQLKLF
jgi:ribonuclease HII